MKTYPVHPVAEMFPLLPQDSQEFADLVNSIEGIGLLEPIVLDGDVLIDGRNRLAACYALGSDIVTPRYVQWSEINQRGTRVEDFIISKNIARRHLTADQRVTICTQVHSWRIEQENAKKKAESQFKPGGSRKPTVEPDSVPPCRDLKTKVANSTVGQLAEKANVSRHKASLAISLDKAAKNGTAHKELIEEVKTGKTTLAAAVKQITSQPKPKAKPELSLEERFEKWWNHAFTKQWAACDIPQIKKWIKEKLAK